MSRSSYLQSTAMAAVMATGAFSGVAPAADAVVEPPAYEPPAAQYYFSVEGSVVFAKPSVDKVGYDPDNDVGLYAGVAFGRKITPAWDWRVGLAFTNFEDNDSDGDFDDETLTSELRFATADLEAGFAAVENTSTNLRFFGGLRVLWEDDSAEATLFDGFDRQDSDFLGIGPRIGADFQSRFGDSRFGMSGMVAGAAIWGNGTSTATSTTNSATVPRERRGLQSRRQSGYRLSLGQYVKVHSGLSGAAVVGPSPSARRKQHGHRRGCPSAWPIPEVRRAIGRHQHSDDLRAKARDGARRIARQVPKC